jgi:hypothetical protein
MGVIVERLSDNYDKSVVADALDKLKNLQEVSDFLLQEKSDPISKASQQVETRRGA